MQVQYVHDIKIKQRDIYTEIVEPSIRRQPGEGVKKEKDISQYSPSNLGRVDRNLHFERKKVEIIGSNSPPKIAPSPEFA